jgi:hypothetical protein
MWRNTEAREFIDWQWRTTPPCPLPEELCLKASLQPEWLGGRRVARPGKGRLDAAREARERDACFDRFEDDGQVYGLMTGLREARSC